MKRFLTLLLAILATSASAQVRTPEPQSIGRAIVMKKSEDDKGLTVILDAGRSTLNRSGEVTPAARKAFRQLQVGRAYLFPEAFNTPANDSATFTAMPLPGLENRAPFRALVDAVDTGDDRISLRLCCADGSKIEYVQIGAQGMDQLKNMIAMLQPEETYEFPAAVQGKQPAAPPAGAEPLDQYVGEWRGALDSDPMFFITMRCAWRTDGQGLWREIMYDDSTEAEPVHDIAVLTADTARGEFLATDLRDSNKLPAASTYDSATKTFTTRLPSFEPGVLRTNTATFTDPNTITWETKSRSDTGAVLSTTTGTYKRLTKKAAQ